LHSDKAGQSKLKSIRVPGRIGAATARRLKAFDVKLLYWSRTHHPDLEHELGLEWTELSDLLARSDIVSLHIPNRPETYHLIGSRELASR